MVTNEKRYSGKIKCGHCGNEAPMVIGTTLSQVRSYEDPKTGVSWEAGPVHELLTCPAHARVSRSVATIGTIGSILTISMWRSSIRRLLRRHQSAYHRRYNRSSMLRSAFARLARMLTESF